MPPSTSPKHYSPPVSPQPKIRSASPSPQRAPQWHIAMLRAAILAGGASD